MQTLANPKPSQRRSHPAIRVRSTVSGWALPLREMGMEEHWKLIPDYPGVWVSDFGMVKSDRMQTGRILRPWREGRGYLTVCLRHLDGRRRNVRVHVLVLRAFRGDPEFGMECRHLNGNPADNRLCNLVWGTHQQNCHDTSVHGRIHCGEQSKVSKLTRDQAREIRDSAGTLTAYRVAKMFGITHSHVARIRAGQCWACLV
jgi:hypothetical protein